MIIIIIIVMITMILIIISGRCSPRPSRRAACLARPSERVPLLLFGPSSSVSPEDDHDYDYDCYYDYYYYYYYYYSCFYYYYVAFPSHAHGAPFAAFDVIQGEPLV